MKMISLIITIMILVLYSCSNIKQKYDIMETEISNNLEEKFDNIEKQRIDGIGSIRIHKYILCLSDSTSPYFSLGTKKQIECVNAILRKRSLDKLELQLIFFYESGKDFFGKDRIFDTGFVYCKELDLGQLSEDELNVFCIRWIETTKTEKLYRYGGRSLL